MFLCHARLYKFADRYGCAQLMSLTLHKLRLTLCKYRLYTSRTGDIINLIRYTYTHTADQTDGHAKLRAVVLDFVVGYCYELAQHLPFIHLLEEGGPFAGNFLAKTIGLVR